MNVRNFFIVKEGDQFRQLYETYSGRFFLQSPGLIEIPKNEAMKLLNEGYELDNIKNNGISSNHN